MAKYKVTTDQGSYVVTTEDAAPAAPAQANAAPTSPADLLSMVAPSNILKHVGAAAVNAPGVVSAAINSMPGIGNPAAIMPAIQNVVQNPGQVGVAANRALAIQGGAPMTSQEQGPALAGEIAGSVIEGQAPGAVAGKAIQNAAAPALGQAAQGMARRALGFQKRLLTTPFARGKAAQAAQTALEEGVISGNPSSMMQKANELSNVAGQKLGAMRQAAGPTVVDPIFDALETAKAGITKGRTGGVWDVANKRIDDAQETLLGLVNKGDKVSLNDVIEAKTRLGKSINWLNDNAAQSDTKAIVQTIEKAVEDVLGKKGGDVKAYRNLKRLYGDAELMKKGLSNEVAGDQGRDLVSLGTKVIGAGIGGGNPLTGAAAAGAAELLKRRGAGMSAKLAYDLATKGSATGTAALGGATGLSADALMAALRRNKQRR